MAKSGFVKTAIVRVMAGSAFFASFKISCVAGSVLQGMIARILPIVVNNQGSNMLVCLMKMELGTLTNIVRESFMYFFTMFMTSCISLSSVRPELLC